MNVGSLFIVNVDVGATYWVKGVQRLREDGVSILAKNLQKLTSDLLTVMFFLFFFGSSCTWTDN